MPLLLTIILTVFFLTDSFSQTTSKLYNTKGGLLADTSFKITKQQLTKWIKIEDTLTKNILNRLIYPTILFENEISGLFIISFTVDTGGIFNNFNIEKYFDKMSKDTLQKEHIKMFAFNSTISIKYYSGQFEKKGFKTKKGSEKYYLPFDFRTNHDSTIRQIKKGWLTLDEALLLHEIRRD